MKTVHVSAVDARRSTRILVRECRSLHAAGYRVVVVAPGERTGEHDGIHYRGVAVPRGRLARMTAGAWRLLRASLAERPDIVHVHTPELLPWMLPLRLRGMAVVFDAHEDIVGDIDYKHYIPGPLKPAVKLVMTGVYRLTGRVASAVLAATPQVGAHFGAGRASFLYNLPRLEEFARTAETGRVAEGAAGRFIYVGDLTEARGLGQLLDAAHLVAPDGYEVILAGRASTAAAQAWLADGVRPGNVDWHGWVDRTRVVELMGAAGAGLCLLQPYRSYREALPVKVYEYMAAGLPVIASDFQEWHAQFGHVGCAVLVDPTDPAAIAAAMRTLAQAPERAREMGAKGRAAALSHLNWQSQEAALLRVYAQLAG